MEVCISGAASIGEFDGGSKYKTIELLMRILTRPGVNLRNLLKILSDYDRKNARARLRACLQQIDYPVCLVDSDPAEYIDS